MVLFLVFTAVSLDPEFLSFHQDRRLVHIVYHVCFGQVDYVNFVYLYISVHHLPYVYSADSLIHTYCIFSGKSPDLP